MEKDKDGNLGHGQGHSNRAEEDRSLGRRFRWNLALAPLANAVASESEATIHDLVMFVQENSLNYREGLEIDMIEVI